MNHEKLLDLKVRGFDFEEETTIRGYLHKLLATLWIEGESFSGQRPFGNSGWEYDIYKPLVQCGAVKGELDEDGCIEEVDIKAAHDLVLRLIGECFAVKS